MKFHHLSFLASRSYQNINFGQIKTRDINLMITYLIFYQNCNFSCDPWRGNKLKWFFTIFGRKQPMRRELANSLLKAKIKIKQLVDLRNIYLNMVVFALELLIFWSWFWIWIWKYRFPKFLKILFFPPNPHRAFACMRGRSSRVSDPEILSFLASKSYQNIDLDRRPIKNRDINLMVMYLIFYQNSNFLGPM